MAVIGDGDGFEKPWREQVVLPLSHFVERLKLLGDRKSWHAFREELHALRELMEQLGERSPSSRHKHPYSHHWATLEALEGLCELWLVVWARKSGQLDKEKAREALLSHGVMLANLRADRGRFFEKTLDQSLVQVEKMLTRVREKMAAEEG